MYKKYLGPKFILLEKFMIVSSRANNGHVCIASFTIRRAEVPDNYKEITKSQQK